MWFCLVAAADIHIEKEWCREFLFIFFVARLLFLFCGVCGAFGGGPAAKTKRGQKKKEKQWPTITTNTAKRFWESFCLWHSYVLGFSFILLFLSFFFTVSVSVCVQVVPYCQTEPYIRGPTSIFVLFFFVFFYRS